MVALVPVIFLLSLTWFCSPLQAVTIGDINATLLKLVELLKKKSYVEFDTWTRQLSLTWEKEEQELLAWKVDWLKVLEEDSSPEELQVQLKPSNALKLRMWLRFYWELRRFGKLNGILRANFALELRDLRRKHPETESHQLQNMWQSLPRSLRILFQSRWLCLQHSREMFYVAARYHLSLGANDNCSLWRTREVGQNYLLHLTNYCDEERYFDLDMLEDNGGSYQLLRSTSYMNNTYCVLRGVAYFKETSQVAKWDKGCQWQLNDCSFLPSLSADEQRKLKKNYGE